MRLRGPLSAWLPGSFLGFALGGLGGCAPPPAELLTLTVVTFNSGTNPQMRHDDPPDDGYTSAHAAISDEHYGDGLAWVGAIDATRTFFDQLRPDIVAFQEIFNSNRCPSVPLNARKDFVCENWQSTDPPVVASVLGPDYQVACHTGADDKCAAVHKSLGTFEGCSMDFCAGGLSGAPAAGCGTGARVGRGVIELVGGGELTIVSYHGTSGLAPDDRTCRVAQTDQVFVDSGSGSSAVGESHNLVLGDLNTDPGRLAILDESAAHWLEFVDPPAESWFDCLSCGPDRDFHFVSDVGPTATPTYLEILNIDHVISDVAQGTCWSAGVGGRPPVTGARYFDHMPLVCEIEMARPPAGP